MELLKAKKSVTLELPMAVKEVAAPRDAELFAVVVDVQSRLINA